MTIIKDMAPEAGEIDNNGGLFATLAPPEDAMTVVEIVNTTAADSKYDRSIYQCAERVVTVLFSDPQYHWFSKNLGLFGTSFANVIGPGYRLAGQNLSVSALHEELVIQTIEGMAEGLRQCVAGTEGLGDFGDLRQMPEIRHLFFETVRRLADRGDAYRTIGMAPSNHDTYYRGAELPEFSIPFVFSLLGKVEKRHRVNAETGDPAHWMDKSLFIREKYRALYKTDPKTLHIVQRGYDRDGDVNDFVARNWKGEVVIGNWRNHNDLVSKIWVQEAPGRWEATVHFGDPDVKPGEEEHPERSLFQVSLYKRKELPLPDGTRAGVYAIYSDTVDLTDTHFFNRLSGSLDGYVSRYQDHVIQAAMERIRSVDPRALFIDYSHYPATGLAKTPNYLKGIDFSISGHRHRRGFDNLTAALGLDRDQPLIYAGIPSSTDWPNEDAFLDIHIDPNDPWKIVFDLNYLQIDENRVEGTNETVQAEMNKLAPRLYHYQEALDHITHPGVREFADPTTTELKRAYLTLHLPDGLLSGLGHDGVIRHSAPGDLTAYARSSAYQYVSYIKLSLLEAGFAAEAKRFEKQARLYLEELTSYYEWVWQRYHGDLQGEGNGPNDPLYGDEIVSPHQRSKFYQATMGLAARLSPRPIPSDPQAKASREWALEGMKDIFVFFSKEWEAWLQQYERLERRDALNREWIGSMNLMGGRHAKRLEMAVHRLPRGTMARALSVHVGLESARLQKEFRADKLRRLYYPKGEEKGLDVVGRLDEEGQEIPEDEPTLTQMPDRITVTKDLRSGSIAVRTELPRFYEIDGRSRSPWPNSLINLPGGVRSLFKSPFKVGEDEERETESGWSFETRYRFGSGVSYEDEGGEKRVQRGGLNGGPAMAILYTLPIWDYATLPQLRLEFGAETYLDFEKRDVTLLRSAAHPAGSTFDRSFFSMHLDTTAQAGVFLGDPTGLIAFRAGFQGGVSAKHFNNGGQSSGQAVYGGYAGLSLGGGLIFFGWDGRWYTDRSSTQFGNVWLRPVSLIEGIIALVE